MFIREYTEADLDALRRMHARQGFGYAFPDLADPLFVSKLVVENDDGRPVMAALARLTCEMYLLVDRSNESGDRADESNGARESGAENWPLIAGTAREHAAAGEAGNALSGEADNSRAGPARNAFAAARERYAQLLALHAAGEQDLLARGLEDAHAWLPPPVARRFGRRLASLGWVRDDRWTPYCRRLKASG